MAHMASLTPGRRVTSIFFGGGTPSLMPPGTAEALIDAVAEHWHLDPEAEITLEANPTSVEAEAFMAFRAAGINRVSLGVQALKPEALKFLGRQHSADEALQAINLAARIFPRYSFDLIYARPGQTVQAWEEELREALQYADGHLSLYQLTIEENTAFYTAYAKGAFALPEEEGAAALYVRTQDIMEEAGLPAYEISNHARPGEESRHNLAYWLGTDYVGIGPGAHGRITTTKRFATQTLKSPERWLEAVARQGHGLEVCEPVEETAGREEKLMMRLRLAEGFARAEMPFIDEKKISRLRGYGLLSADAARIQPTLKGRLVLNALTAALMG